MGFERALGHDVEAPPYHPQPVGRHTRVDRIRAFFWYRFGWGHRPEPRRHR